MSYLGSVLLALLSAWFVLKPHFVHTRAEAEANSLRSEDSSPELQNLTDQKERCVQLLRDLELDYGLQNISESDYESMRASLRLELGGVLEKLKNRQ